MNLSCFLPARTVRTNAADVPLLGGLSRYAAGFAHAQSKTSQPSAARPSCAVTVCSEPLKPADRKGVLSENLQNGRE